MDIIDLFQAIRLNEENIFLSAINDSDINQLNEFGQNLLHEAVIANNLIIGEMLISSRINVNHQDKKGQTPLHYAALNKSITLAESILKNGGKLSISDNYGNEPLWTAVFNAKGEYKMVELFVKYGADINYKNNSKRSPYDFATQIKDKKLLGLL